MTSRSEVTPVRRLIAASAAIVSVAAILIVAAHALEIDRARADDAAATLHPSIALVLLLAGSALVVLALTNVFARLRAESALRMSDARFRRLYESDMIGVAFWSRDGVVQEANDEVLRLFGVSREEVPGWRWDEQAVPGAAVWEEAALRDLRETGRCVVDEQKCVRRDGTPVWLRLAAATLDDGRYIAFATDVTDCVVARQALERAHDVLAARVAELEGIEAADLARERAQVDLLARRLAAATEELETFSYSVSHDLRAPLRAIDGFSRELELNVGPELDPLNARYLGRIRAATQRMSQLIDDLLNLSRLSRRPLERRGVDVSGMAGEVARELGASHIVVQPGLVASADPHLLRIVLENLIGNAVKFSSRREEPRIDIFGAGDGSIAIRDNGAGFDMQYASKMFAPFQRLHPVAQFEGTGIGLAIVHRIVSRHGGSIRAESAPDQGATFYFTLGDIPA